MCPTTSSGPSPTATSGQPKKGGTLISRAPVSHQSRSPQGPRIHLGRASSSSSTATSWRLDENLGVQPDLADPFRRPRPTQDVTVKLRTGVKFHNGDPLTSADVKYTFDRIIDTRPPRSRGRSSPMWNDHGAGPATVIFNLKNPNAALIAYMATRTRHSVPEVREANRPFEEGDGDGTVPSKSWKWSRQLSSFDGTRLLVRASLTSTAFRINVVPDESNLARRSARKQRTCNRHRREVRRHCGARRRHARFEAEPQLQPAVPGIRSASR